MVRLVSSDELRNALMDFAKASGEWIAWFGAYDSALDQLHSDSRGAGFRALVVAHQAVAGDGGTWIDA
jgi:hypothetical protein